MLCYNILYKIIITIILLPCTNQVYTRLNHVNMCVSYSSTLRLMDQVSKLHTIPISKWIENGEVIKFWDDNVDRKQRVRDMRADNQGKMMHMFSMLVGRSRTPAPHLSHVSQVLEISQAKHEGFLPGVEDARKVHVKGNLVIIVGRILTKYIVGLLPLAKAIPKHIQHEYSREMFKKSDVVVLDALIKNEACHTDMIDIMKAYQE